MSNLQKILLLIPALAMILSACGEAKNNESSAPDKPGETASASSGESAAPKYTDEEYNGYEPGVSIPYYDEDFDYGPDAASGRVIVDRYEPGEGGELQFDAFEFRGISTSDNEDRVFDNNGRMNMIIHQGSYIGAAFDVNRPQDYGYLKNLVETLEFSPEKPEIGGDTFVILEHRQSGSEAVYSFVFEGYVIKRVLGAGETPDEYAVLDKENACRVAALAVEYGRYPDDAPFRPAIFRGSDPAAEGFEVNYGDYSLTLSMGDKSAVLNREEAVAFVDDVFGSKGKAVAGRLYINGDRTVGDDCIKITEKYTFHGQSNDKEYETFCYLMPDGRLFHEGTNSSIDLGGRGFIVSAYMYVLSLDTFDYDAAAGLLK